jgi:UDP-N-acetylglucosamine diphosphorylase/glucosamine-1-phosphate N-acetyltransferase
VDLIGPGDRLFLDPSARVEPAVVIDTTGGPVVVAAGAVVTAFTRLEGPCYVGPGTQVLSAQVKAGTSVGPHCRLGGEVEASVVQGYSNKAHEGFLGHSYVGEWVNLAAGTHTSDLRLDYAPVTVPADGATLATGRLKVGSFVGDHAKTGLGVLLNCGSVVGVFANVLPTGTLLPRDVPSFTRAGPDGVWEDLHLDALFATADAVMRRRGRSLSRVREAVYRAVAAQTAAHRRRVVGPDEPARHRKAG